MQVLREVPGVYETGADALGWGRRRPAERGFSPTVTDSLCGDRSPGPAPPGHPLGGTGKFGFTTVRFRDRGGFMTGSVFEDRALHGRSVSICALQSRSVSIRAVSQPCGTTGLSLKTGRLHGSCGFTTGVSLKTDRLHGRSV